VSVISKKLFGFIVGISLLAGSFTAHTQTLEELISSDKLRIKSWIDPSDKIIARQQINLYIEIATDKWFSGGTRIGRVEIDDAILLQREQFAVNSTRTEGGKSWTVQMWTLVIYPQRDGAFEIPAIPLRLAIAGEGLKAISGGVFTERLEFTATIPEELKDKANWVVTTQFDVKESFDKSLEGLKPGDALIRTIDMSASDLPAMMLPEYTVETLPGIAIYLKPPEVTDKINRGQYLAGRTEVLTYVFEQSGNYQLPEQVYFWWNLQSQKMEFIELPARTLTIGIADSSGAEMQLEGQKLSDNIDFSLAIKYLGSALLILLLIWLTVRKLDRIFTPARPPHSSLPSEATLRRQLHQACSQNNSEKAVSLFYKLLDNYAGNQFHGSVRQLLGKTNETQLATEFDTIMRSVYAESNGNEIDLKNFSSQFVKQMKILKRSDDFSRWAVELKLN